MSPLPTAQSLTTRLDALEARLDALAAGGPRVGLTEPDDGGTERWDSGQVWAHMAEFVPYWHAQIRSVVEGYDGTPVAFGRTKSDPNRIARIEAARSEPIDVLRRSVGDSVGLLLAYLRSLAPQRLGRRGSSFSPWRDGYRGDRPGVRRPPSRGARRAVREAR